MRSPSGGSRGREQLKQRSSAEQIQIVRVYVPGIAKSLALAAGTDPLIVEPRRCALPVRDPRAASAARARSTRSWTMASAIERHERQQQPPRRDSSGAPRANPPAKSDRADPEASRVFPSGDTAIATQQARSRTLQADAGILRPETKWTLSDFSLTTLFRASPVFWGLPLHASPAFAESRFFPVTRSGPARIW